MREASVRAVFALMEREGGSSGGIRRKCKIRVGAGRFSRRSPKQLLGNLWVETKPGRWRPALTVPSTLADLGFGSICKIQTETPPFCLWARNTGCHCHDEKEWRPVKWLRKLLREAAPTGQRKTESHARWILSESWYLW